MHTLIATLVILATGTSLGSSCIYPLLIKETYQSRLSFCETYQESLSRHKLSSSSLGSLWSSMTAQEAEYFLSAFKELDTRCYYREISYTLLPERKSGFAVLEGKGVDLIKDAAGDIPCGRGQLCRAIVAPRTRIAAHVYHHGMGQLVQVFVETSQPIVNMTTGKVFGAGGRSVCNLTPAGTPTSHSK